MDTKDFCYWLQGFFELDSQEGLTKNQIEKIKKKLDSCFVHEAKDVKLPKPQLPPMPHKPNKDDITYRC